MKYCVNCGAELYDEAVVCVKCGRSAAPSYDFGFDKRKNPVQNDGNSSIVEVFRFISNVLCAISMLFLACSFAYAEVIEYRYGIFFYLDYTFATIALISSIVSFGMGLVTFILALAKKQRNEKLFPSVYTWIKTIILLVTSIIMMYN